jgi:hypothetical protein
MRSENVATTNISQQQTGKTRQEDHQAVASNQLRLDCTFVEASQKWMELFRSLVVMETVAVD